MRSSSQRASASGHQVSDRVCARLAFLDVKVDPSANAAADPDCDVAADGSSARVLVIRAREDLVAARAARRVLG